MTSVRGPLIVLLCGIGRYFLTEDPSQFAIGVILPIWHVWYTTKHSRSEFATTSTHIMAWIFTPHLYILWVISWDVMEVMGKGTRVIVNRKSKKRVLCNKEWYNKIKEHSLSGFILGTKVNIIGTNFEAEFIKDVGPNDYVFDENYVMTDMEQVRVESDKAWGWSHTYLSMLTIMLFYAMAGNAGLALGLAVVFFVKSSHERSIASGIASMSKEKVKSTTPLNLADGVYKLKIRLCDWPYHVGIGYSKEGVMHTRYHVTKGNPIEVDDRIHYPCYVNEVKDICVYGGVPKYAPVADREEVYVALAGPDSSHILTYKTTITMDDQGIISFVGNRSKPGCSGSPIFRKVTTEVRREGIEHHEVTYALVGTIGWFYDSQGLSAIGEIDRKTAVEIVATQTTASDYTVEIVDKDVVQVFKHPGAGKTRTVAAELIRDGLAKYNKVYFTGPTRTVCSEAYNILSEMFPDQVALYTSNATMVERGGFGRPIIVAAHATMLSMLCKGSREVLRKGLWIMDEAHFMDVKTMVLKDILRHKVKRDSSGALVEMTATGYDIRKKDYVIMDGSNANITDSRMSAEDMVSNIIGECKDKKILVFVTAQHGRDPTTSVKLANAIDKVGGKYIMLSRETFAAKYELAKNMDKGVILTTDISECGANIHPDIVYDFQMTSKMVVVRANVLLTRRLIDQSQRVQRRGRVGRDPGKSDATYVSPSYVLDVADFSRVEHQERMIIAEALGIDILDPTPEKVLNISITPQQVSTWASSGENGMDSLYLLEMLTDASGNARTKTDFERQVHDWINGEAAEATVNNTNVTIRWWDDRVRGRLEDILYEKGVVNEPPGRKKGRYNIYQTVLKYVGRQERKSVVDAHGNLRDSEEPEFENVNEQAECDEEGIGADGDLFQ